MNDACLSPLECLDERVDFAEFIAALTAPEPDAARVKELLDAA